MIPVQVFVFQMARGVANSDVKEKYFEEVEITALLLLDGDDKYNLIKQLVRSGISLAYAVAIIDSAKKEIKNFF